MLYLILLAVLAIAAARAIARAQSRGVVLAVVGVSGGFVLFVAVSAMNTTTTHAMSEFFPVSGQQVINHWKVVWDKDDPCFEVVREGSGFEIHAGWFDIHSLGSKHMAITVDMNHQAFYMLSPNFVSYGNTPGQNGQGDRYYLPEGEEGTVWTTGGCGFGSSFYPGMPAQACISVNRPCPGGHSVAAQTSSVQAIPVAAPQQQNAAPARSTGDITIEEVLGFCSQCAGRLSYLYEDPNDSSRGTAVKFLIGSGSCVDITVPPNVNVQGWDGTKTVGGSGPLHLCEATFRRKNLAAVPSNLVQFTRPTSYALAA